MLILVGPGPHGRVDTGIKTTHEMSTLRSACGALCWHSRQRAADHFGDEFHDRMDTCFDSGGELGRLGALAAAAAPVQVARPTRVPRARISTVTAAPTPSMGHQDFVSSVVCPLEASHTLNTSRIDSACKALVRCFIRLKDMGTAGWTARL